jgi:hypothetical protein
MIGPRNNNIERGIINTGMLGVIMYMISFEYHTKSA